MGPYSVLYAVFLFFVTIGLFNIISAIFVDSTLAHAQKSELTQRLIRLDDEELWAKNVAIVIKKCLALNNVELTSTLLEAIEDLQEAEFPRQVFEEALEDLDVSKALGALDIDPMDHKKLCDVLDPDRDGHIHILDLVTGLMRLRGHPSRSDVICVDLMVRSLQNKLCQLEEFVTLRSALQ